MQVVRLPDTGAVLSATGRDHYARNTIRPDLVATHGWAYGAAVAWVGIDAEDRTPYVSVLGPVDEAVALVERSLGEWPDHPVTMPAEVVDACPGVVDARYHWLFRTAARAPKRSLLGDAVVTVLRTDSDERIDDLLDASSELVSARPGDRGVRRWVVVEEHGKVLACAADTSGSPGIGHMGAVAVHPSARGRGLGSAVVGWLTTDLLRSGCDVVAVGVFVGETAAQRLYDRLGYRTEHELVSGPRV